MIAQSEANLLVKVESIHRSCVYYHCSCDEVCISQQGLNLHFLRKQPNVDYKFIKFEELGVKC